MNALSRAALALALLAATCGVQAQAWPARPITFVTSSGPGGQSDSVVRALGEGLKERLKQPVNVDNKPGANSTIAAQYGARAAPDGYTYVFMGMGSHTPIFSKNNSIDLSKAMLPVANVYGSDFFFVVRANLPVTSMRELIAWSGHNDLKVGGAQATVELAVAMLNSALAKTGSPSLKARYIPYRNDPAIVTAMLSGDVDLAIASPSTFNAHVKAGTLRPLMISGVRRSPLYPDVPTPAEQGIPDYNFSFSVGVWAPQGTPAEIVRRMGAEIQAEAKRKEFVDRLAAMGVDAAGSTADQQFQTYVNDLRFWTEAVRITGYQPQ